MSHNIFSKNGLIWGQTQSGKTWRASQLIQECPHFCFFINTQLVPRVETFAQITVKDNVEVINAIENKTHKICINYQLDWNNSDSYTQKVDELVMLLFTIAKNNPDHFRATVIIDEIDKFVSKHKVSASIDNLFNRGLRFNLNAVGIGHIPQQINNKLIDASSWYIFYKVTQVAAQYWKQRGIDLESLEYGNYEGYYWENDQIWLFSHNRPTTEQPEISDDILQSEQLQEPSPLGNSDVPDERQDLDSDMHPT